MKNYSSKPQRGDRVYCMYHTGACRQGATFTVKSASRFSNGLYIISLNEVKGAFLYNNFKTIQSARDAIYSELFI